MSNIYICAIFKSRQGSAVFFHAAMTGDTMTGNTKCFLIVCNYCYRWDAFSSPPPLKVVKMNSSLPKMFWKWNPLSRITKQWFEEKVDGRIIRWRLLNGGGLLSASPRYVNNTSSLTCNYLRFWISLFWCKKVSHWLTLSLNHWMKVVWDDHELSISKSNLYKFFFFRRYALSSAIRFVMRSHNHLWRLEGSMIISSNPGLKTKPGKSRSKYFIKPATSSAIIRIGGISLDSMKWIFKRQKTCYF